MPEVRNSALSCVISSSSMKKNEKRKALLCQPWLCLSRYNARCACRPSLTSRLTLAQMPSVSPPRCPHHQPQQPLLWVLRTLPAEHQAVDSPKQKTSREWLYQPWLVGCSVILNILHLAQQLKNDLLGMYIARITMATQHFTRILNLVILIDMSQGKKHYPSSQEGSLGPYGWVSWSWAASLEILSGAVTLLVNAFPH